MYSPDPCFCPNPFCQQVTTTEYKAGKLCKVCRTSFLLNGRYLINDILSSSKDEKIKTYSAFDCHEPKSFKIIKMLTDKDDERYINCFLSEGRALEKIKCDYVPKIIENNITLKIDEQKEVNYHVIEKIDGVDLQTFIHKHILLGEKISQNIIVDFIEQMIHALNSIHSQRFLHLDIKPENIIVKADGTFALIDFDSAFEITDLYLMSLSSTIELEKYCPNEHVMKGTPGFAPWEQLTGKPLPQSDFFALGRTVIAMIVDKPIQILIAETKQNLKGEPYIDKLAWKHRVDHIDKNILELIDFMVSAKVAKRPFNTKIIRQVLDSNISSEFYKFSHSQLINSLSADFDLALSIKIKKLPDKVSENKELQKVEFNTTYSNVLCSISMTKDQYQNIIDFNEQHSKWCATISAKEWRYIYGCIIVDKIKLSLKPLKSDVKANQSSKI